MPAIFGFIGSVSGGGIVVFGQWLNHRQEEHRALTEFAIKTAVENWRQMAEKADRLKMPYHQYGLNPMDGYLIRTLALVEILKKGQFTPKNIQAKLAELDALGRVLEGYLDKKSQPKQNKTDVV